MKQRRVFSFVRPLLLLFSAGASLHLSLGADLPLAPPNHIYDPDFLLSSKGSAELSRTLVSFEQNSDVAINLAVYTATPRVLGETAQDLNEAWNQTGYGVVVVFAPRPRESRVVPSPELSLLEDADHLSATFRDAAAPGLAQGDYTTAAAAGVEALMKRLGDIENRLAPPPKPAWRPTRREMILIGAGLALGALTFLWIAARIWRTANLFDHSYRFAEPTAPATLRFGGRRCGGRMATSEFRAPLKSKDA